MVWVFFLGGGSGWLHVVAGARACVVGVNCVNVASGSGAVVSVTWLVNGGGFVVAVVLMVVAMMVRLADALM